MSILDYVNPWQFLHTAQDQFSDAILNFDPDAGRVEVNGDGTVLSYFSSQTAADPFLIVTGTGLEIDENGAMTAGTITSFTYQVKPFFDPLVVYSIFSGVSLGAAAVQGAFDAGRQLLADNGGNFLEPRRFLAEQIWDQGDKTINGSDGSDLVSAIGGSCTVSTGAGDDVVNWDMSCTGGSIDMGSGSNRLVLVGGASTPLVKVKLNQETLSYSGTTIGLSEVQNLRLDSSFSGRATIIGDDLPNQISTGDTHDTIKSLGADDIVHSGGGRDEVFGGNGRDFIVLGSQDDTAYGGFGDDEIFGEGGMDIVWGGSGYDFISGGGGEDELDGDEGNDRIKGGNGSDRIYGGFDQDTLSGDADADRIYGGTHGDRIKGGTGNDRIRGDGGSDVIFGQAGRDRLFGGNGNDQIYGGAGMDLLFAGRGDDLLRGGGNADEFIFDPGDAANVIEDFSIVDAALFVDAVLSNVTITAQAENALVSYSGTTVRILDVDADALTKIQVSDGVEVRFDVG